MSPLTAVGSNLYFMVNSAGSAIWKSDLTAQGTAPVITVGGVAKNFAAFGNLFTFAGGPASQLWATDGTAAGTRRVSNIGALVQPPHPDWMTTIGNTVYFVSSGRYNSGEWYAGYGEEIWKTDGTPEGTVRLFRGQVHDLIDFNGTLYFAGSRPQGGYELWKSDGTAEGTVQVKDVQPTNAGTNLRLLSVVNGRLFFGVNSGWAYQDSNFELWSTDGTAAGTTKATAEPMYIDITSMAPNAMHVYGGAGNYFYFRRYGGGDIHNDELWRTDGTPGGTARVGTATDPRNLTNLNGTLYFTATNPGGFTGETLYRIAPGASGPTTVRTFHSGDAWIVSALTPVGANLFLSGPTTNGTMGLWKIDGATNAATLFRTVPNSTAGPGSPRVAYIADVDGVAYFVMSETDPENVDGIVGSLWKSNGTSAGTLKVRDFSAPVYSTPLFFVSAGGKLVYSDGTNLWRSNGTLGGTVQILRLRDPSQPTFFPPYFGGPAAAVVGDRVFFSASVGSDPRARELRVASLTTPDAPSDLIVADQPPDETPPPEPLPAGVVAAAAQANGVRLAWRDNSANESGFVIERSRTSDFALPDATFFRPANATSFVDATAGLGAVYFYRVRAVNAGGDSLATDPATKSASVAGRYVFYNHSAYDGNDAAAGAADDAAVATDKRAYLPGPTAVIPGFTSVTSYARGINGVMIDLAGLPIGTLSAGDFELSVGGGTTWKPAPAPTSVTVRRGAGAAGSDRVTLTFADGSIRNTWLRVTVLANAHTGLARPDVFSFGNLIGESGDRGTQLKVTALDLAATLRAMGKPTTVTGRYDFNRDGKVNAFDVAAVRSNLNRGLATSVAPPATALAQAGTTSLARPRYAGATRELFQDQAPIA
jgi:ELWxxDGT repeat protein